MDTGDHTQTGQVSAILRADQIQALDAFAHTDNRSRSAVIAMAVCAFLARVAKPPLSRDVVHASRGGTAATAGVIRSPAVAAPFKTRATRK
jgi:hypothetical protein